MLTSRMKKSFLFFMDGSDPARKSRIEYTAKSLLRDLEYTYAIDGIPVSVKVIYKAQAFKKILKSREHISCLIIDDRIEGLTRDPSKIGKLLESYYIHSVVPVIRRFPAKKYFEAGLYRAIFDRDIAGSNDLLLELVLNGRGEEAARTYLEIKTPEEPISEEALRSTIIEMIKENIKDIKRLTRGTKRVRALKTYKAMTDKEVAPYIAKKGQENVKRDRDKKQQRQDGRTPKELRA